MELAVKQHVISPVTMAQAQNLLTGDSSKCGQVWCRYHWVNTVIAKIMDAYRDWSFNWKCNAVISSIEQKHFGHTDKALTDLIDFVTTKVGDPDDIRRRDLRAPLLKITHDTISAEMQKRCPTLLPEFNQRYYGHILQKPHLLSLTATSREPAIHEIDLISKRNQAIFGRRPGIDYDRDMLAAFGSHLKPAQLSNPAQVQDKRFQNETLKRLGSKIQMALQSKEPIDLDKLREVLGTDMECLSPGYRLFLIDALQRIQEYPAKKEQELIAEEAYRIAIQESKKPAADFDLINQKYAVKAPLHKLAELMDSLVVFPLAEIIFNGNEVEEKYLRFIDDPDCLRNEVEQAYTEEEIVRSIRRHLCPPRFEKINVRLLKDIESHVNSCIQKQFASQHDLMEALFANKNLLNMIDRPLLFTEAIFALGKAKKADVPNLVRGCIHKYAKHSENVDTGIFKKLKEFYDLETDIQSLEDEISSWEKKKKEFNDSRFDEEWKLLNFKLIDACTNFPVPENLIEAEQLRNDLIEKNGLLKRELGRLEMAERTGASEKSEVASKVQEIQDELDDLSTLGDVLKKWIDLQGRFEKVRDKHFVDIDKIIASKQEKMRFIQQKCDLMFDELYDWAIVLGQDPQNIGSFLGQNWNQEVIDEYKMTQKTYAECQKNLLAAQEKFFEATAFSFNDPLPGMVLSLNDYLRQPSSGLETLLWSSLNPDLQKIQAKRREEQAKKITPIILQKLVDDTAAGARLDLDWCNTACEELFELVRKISGREALDRNEKALLAQMMVHIHKPIFDLLDEEKVLIQEFITSDSRKWNSATIAAWVKFLSQYEARMLALRQT